MVKIFVMYYSQKVSYFKGAKFVDKWLETFFFYGKKIGKKLLWFYTNKENISCEYVSLRTIKVSYINFS